MLNQTPLQQVTNDLSYMVAARTASAFRIPPKEGIIDMRLATYSYLRHDPAFRFCFGFLISSSKWEREINKQRKTVDV